MMKSNLGPLVLIRRIGVVVLFVCGGVSTAPLDAQDTSACSPSTDPWRYLSSCARSLVPEDTTSLTAGFKEAFDSLESPTTLNSALGEFGALTGTSGFLGKLHLHFVSVYDQASDGAQSLGMRYEWDRRLARTPHRQGSRHFGFDTGIEARGLLTHRASRNPEDFLETSVSSKLYLGAGGAADPAFLEAHVATLGDSIEKYETSAALRASDGYRRFMGAIWDSLSTQVYLTAGPEGRYETNQSFDRDQWAYGVRAGLDVKAWNPRSALARANFFDWPAALLRWATGATDGFEPSGSAFPTVLLTYHRVDPGANPTREALSGLDPYGRFGLDVAYRSKLADSKQGPLWIEITFRHHTEIDPDSAVKRAGLHRFNRLFLVVEGPNGFVMSWATGSLPLDLDDADHWGIGFQFHF